MTLDFMRNHVAKRDWLMSIDLAQGGGDFTAMSVIERTEPANGDYPTYAVRVLDRFNDRQAPKKIPLWAEEQWDIICRLHQDQVVRRTGRLGSGPLDPPVRMVVDVTGVGDFGTETLAQAGWTPTLIKIHGGDAVSRPEPDIYRVPKRDIAGALGVLLRDRRLTWDRSLPLAGVLEKELANFKVKIGLHGHDSYGAGTLESWRDGSHDDLVLSVGMGAWIGEYEGLQPDPIELGMAMRAANRAQLRGVYGQS